MQVAILGMGRMGLNMARRLCDFGHRVVCWNRQPKNGEVKKEEEVKKLTGLGEQVKVKELEKMISDSENKILKKEEKKVITPEVVV